MQLGDGIKQSSAEKLAAKIKPDLLDGETVLLVCKCNNFKPLVDRVLLTDRRLLAASLTDGKIKYWASHGEVVDAVAESNWSGATLTITKRDGTRTVFKSMDVADADAVRAHLHSSGGAAQPDILPANDAGGSTQAQVAEQPGAVAKFGSSMSKAYGDAQAAGQVRDAHNRNTYGQIVKKGVFGATTVEIYERGFVRIGLFLTQKSPFEKLASISFTTQVQDKSAGGRAVAAGLTMGLSTFTSNEKRVLFLTVATDKKVHTLQAEGGMGRTEDKAGLALEAAGKAVLEATRRSDAGQTMMTQSVPSATVGEQLRQVADLHNDGVLSDEEFATAKAKLLEQL
ncbi:SHOCT domain-containing protein [Nocardioides pacificus]